MGWNPSNIKPLGWLIILAIIGVGYWYGIKPRLGGTVPSLGSLIPGAGQSGGSNGPDIIVLTTKTKEAWMQKEIDAFNASNPPGKASLDLMESRDSMQAILNGKEKPAVWSPSSPVWIYRLAQIFPQGHIDPNSTALSRDLFKSPLVFLVNRDKASTLTPILTGPHPFDHIRNLNAHGVTIRFGYADPINASSGMLTMALLLNEYSELHNGIDPSQAAGSSAFGDWLQGVNRGLVRSDLAGSTQLEQAFESDPTSRDFITAYESAALAAVAANPSLSIVYPSPTANAEQSAVVVGGPWLSDSQQKTAAAFMTFIASPQSLADGIDYNFRPEGPEGASQLKAHLTGDPAAQYHLSYTSVELPTYDALNEAAATWHTQVH